MFRYLRDNPMLILSIGVAAVTTLAVGFKQPELAALVSVAVLCYLGWRVTRRRT
jgi:hypothetical protein